MKNIVPAVNINIDNIVKPNRYRDDELVIFINDDAAPPFLSIFNWARERDKEIKKFEIKFTNQLTASK